MTRSSNYVWGDHSLHINHSVGDSMIPDAVVSRVVGEESFWLGVPESYSNGAEGITERSPAQLKRFLTGQGV